MTKRKKLKPAPKSHRRLRAAQGLKKQKTYTAIGYLRVMQKEVEKKGDTPIYLDEKAQRRILDRLLRQIGLTQIKRRNEQPRDGIQRLYETTRNHLGCLEDCLLWHERLIPRAVLKEKAREERIAERKARKEQREALAEQRSVEIRQQNEMFPNLILVRDKIKKLNADSKNFTYRGVASNATAKVNKLLKMNLGAHITWPLPSWKEINSGNVYGH
jgi:hypothetical protein